MTEILYAVACSRNGCHEYWDAVLPDDYLPEPLDEKGP